MRQCARCNKKRGMVESLFARDSHYCDDCLLTMNQAIRDKREGSGKEAEDPAISRQPPVAPQERNVGG